MPPLTILQPDGVYDGRCGYCSGARGHYTASGDAMTMSCEIYQRMIDRGWRRSGKHLYKLDLPRACCPAYTIKLDSLELSLTKGQRKVLNRWNRFIISGKDQEGDRNKDKAAAAKTKELKKQADKANDPLLQQVHLSEKEFVQGTSVHNFQVTIEPSSYTEEKYELFKEYQEHVHKDYRNSSVGFERFLVDSPLAREPIPFTREAGTHLPQEYGAHHQLYRVDGKLVAMAVLDILPSCVSSVYYVYNPAWEEFSLGKVSAIREACLARELHSYGAPGLKYLYMGYYIHSCQKMRYKADYRPSFILDPEEFSWHPYDSCLPVLDAHHYACFAHPERSKDRDATHNTYGSLTDQNLGDTYAVHAIEEGTVIVEPLVDHESFPSQKRAVCETVSALGISIAKDVIFYL